MSNQRAVIILAAGQGTRMKSKLPKVLHPIAGVPMIVYAIETVRALGAGEVVVVVGHGADEVQSAVRERFGDAVRFALQASQRGTADAVRAGLAAVSADVTEIAVTYGDCPCVPVDCLHALVAARDEHPGVLCALVTMELSDPAGYGRIVRDAAGRVVAIREHRDCSADERRLREVNPGLYALDRSFLAEALARVGSGNAQGEFYLTDLVAMASARGGVIAVPWDAAPLRGINDRAELAELELLTWKTLGDRLRRDGATISATAMIDHGVRVGADAVIGPGVCLRGKTVVEEGAVVEAGCIVDDCAIGAGARIKPYSVLVRSQVGAGAQVGPFAHVRPDSAIGAGAHVGNFVELKKTRMAPGAKANHLAYLGDGDIGANANIGAGTIFCNYDGYAKHTTTIGAGAFVGSNSSLVAPVTIGEGAYVGSGSVITESVPAEALAVGRVRQVNKPGYASRLRALKKSTKP